jgi:mono/diheme cytochrome c family protein
MMDERQKQTILERYKEAKEKGVYFFPDLLAKDAFVALLIFMGLFALAYFIGAPLEPRADPGDSNYTPRPEWYFLFLFQMLKYFPGNLEVVGVVVLPALAVLFLLFLPFIDRGSKRHFWNRRWIMAVTLIGVVGVVGLTVQSVREAPPPAIAQGGDPTALLYTENCSGCHGPTIQVAEGTNLHEVIAQGGHSDGMPAWSGDLTSDEIDALAGFILSPGGSALFTQNCSACHMIEDLVAIDPLVLRAAIEVAPSFTGHAELSLPDWGDVLSSEERSTLLNFFLAPDGQRLFTVNCSSCHGKAVAFGEGEDKLLEVISAGDLHLSMPPWRETLSESEVQGLATYLLDPIGRPAEEALYQQYCVECHGDRIPFSFSLENAREAITLGGSHEVMPVWGDILTEEQLDALVTYTLSTARGTSTEQGQILYGQYCASCHGDFGEGGLNPARSGDVIAPISSSEYLRTRDDFTLQAIIAQGQPNFGMSPFGSSFGGPLDATQLEAIVTFIRAWEDNPPVELPPEVRGGTVSESGAEVYADLCSQCHGSAGQGGIGSALNSADYQESSTDAQLFSVISEGHAATSMIAWGSVLNSDQIVELVNHIRTLSLEAAAELDVSSSPSFSEDIQPIFDRSCVACHGSLGGWDGSTYDGTFNSGNNAPVIIPGDGEGSILGQKILGTQTYGTIMPPGGRLSSEELQLILNWIDDGAMDN